MGFLFWVFFKPPSSPPLAKTLKIARKPSNSEILKHENGSNNRIQASNAPQTARNLQILKFRPNTVTKNTSRAERAKTFENLVETNEK